MREIKISSNQAAMNLFRERKLMALMEYLAQLEDWECTPQVKQDLLDILARGDWDRGR